MTWNHEHGEDTYTPEPERSSLFAELALPFGGLCRALKRRKGRRILLRGEQPLTQERTHAGPQDSEANAVPLSGGTSQRAPGQTALEIQFRCCYMQGSGARLWLALVVAVSAVVR